MPLQGFIFRNCVKFLVFGAPHLHHELMGLKFGVEESTYTLHVTQGC